MAPRVDWIRIGAADERNFDDVVGGDHAGVARVELTGEAVCCERVVQRVDAVGDVERSALLTLRQKVPQGSIERARQADGDALGRDERE